MEKRITNRYKKALSLLLSLTMLFSIILQAVPLADAGVVVDYFPYKYAITDNASSDLNIDSATYSGTLHVVYER
jgi:hypothetical protein